MKISVIMVNFNGLKYLKRTVPAVLKLNYPNFEFIVVDNGSEDGSIEYLEKISGVTLLQSTVKGSKNHACNYAVSRAKGDYVLLIDNDILLEDSNLLLDLERISSPKKIIQLPILNEGEKTTDFYGIFFTFYGASIRKKQVNIKTILKYDKEEVPVGAPHAAINFFEKKAWLNLGGLDEIQPFALDDFDIGPRAWVMGVECILYTKSYVLHLGIKNRKNKEALVKRFRLRFSGLAISMFKSYKAISLIKIFPFFSIVQFIQALRYSFIERNPSIFFAYCSSVFFFVRNLPYIFKKRRDIKRKRILGNDDFLKLKLPF